MLKQLAILRHLQTAGARLQDRWHKPHEERLFEIEHNPSAIDVRPTRWKVDSISKIFPRGRRLPTNQQSELFTPITKSTAKQKL